MSRRSSPAAISYRLVIGGLSGLALLILVLPVVVVLVTSFTDSLSLKFPPPAYSLRWYRALFDPVKSAQIHTAALNSLIVAASATAVSAVLGTLAALAIARRRTWWAQALDSLFMSPLILPALAFGLAALMFFTMLGFRLSLATMILGHVAVITPFILRTTIASLSQLDPAQLDTSASLGAGPLYTFRRVTLPGDPARDPRRGVPRLHGLGRQCLGVAVPGQPRSGRAAHPDVEHAREHARRPHRRGVRRARSRSPPSSCSSWTGWRA